MGIKIHGKDINLTAPAHRLHLPGGWEGCPLPGWATACAAAAGELSATSEANSSGCCRRHRLGLIQPGKSSVPLKELNKGPVSAKEKIKLLHCWL